MARFTDSLDPLESPPFVKGGWGDFPLRLGLDPDRADVGSRSAYRTLEAI
jgi:hypothetical protein